MKGINALIRLHKQHLDVKRVFRTNLETRRAALEEQARAVALDFADEREAAAASIDGSRTFTAYAARMTETLRRMAADIVQIDHELARQNDEIAEAFQTLKSYELTRDARLKDEAQKQAMRDRAGLDEIGAALYRRQTTMN